MACYNHRLLNIPFPSALFKKLLGERPTLRDLEELSPCQARYVFMCFSVIIIVVMCISPTVSFVMDHFRCLKALLEYEDEELELLEQDFTVSFSVRT